MTGFDQPTPVIGAVLGSYRVTAELSSGGMGSVYRAQHEILGRAAAIKLLRPELAANVELVQRFFTEAKAASAIHHPGIIEVFDFGYTNDDRAYLIMELLEGDTLAHRLHSRGGRLAEHEAVQIARGIASALTAAHGKGIVHRDLKPENVFLVPDPDMPSGERPKLLDFGIAKLADALSSNTQTGALIGTPLYMAPEQARAAQAIDHRADLYSLGCILYQMLVGQPPFVAHGSGEIIALHLFTQPERPITRVPITPELDAIVMKLLDKEPRNRFSSAAELSDALGNAFGIVSGRVSVPLSALEISRSGPQLQIPGGVTILDERPDMAPAKRSLMPIIAGVAALALVAIVIAIVSRSSGDPDPTPPPAGSAEEQHVETPPTKGSDAAGLVKAPPIQTVPKPAATPTPPTPPVQRPHVAPPPPTIGKRPVTVPATHPDKALPGPITHPDGAGSGGPVTHTTSNSPIETDVGDDKHKKPN